MAHFFPMLNRGLEICYLDVLVVRSDKRRQGLASMLLKKMKTVAKENGWPFIRWVTGKENNEGPKKLYDNFAKSTLEVYQMDIV